MDWSFVNFLVAIIEPAKQTAQATAAIIAKSNWLISGLATIKTPAKPKITASPRCLVKASPKNKGANNATQTGVENSNAKSCENGMETTAKNHKFCPEKWAKFRNKCRPRRSHLISLRVLAKKPITKTIKRPIIDRYSIISKVFKLVASSRPETAIRLNDTIAPIIQTVAFSGSDLVVMIESSGTV